MNLLSRRSVLAIAAVVDVALHSSSDPVAAKALAARHKLPSRHLETLLQGLVHAKILKGVRGPRGGYELARERRRITVGEIVRTAMSLSTADPEDLDANSVLLERVIDPAVRSAGETFLASLDAITVEQMCEAAIRRMCSRTRRSAAISLPNGATFGNKKRPESKKPRVGGSTRGESDALLDSIGAQKIETW